MNDHLLDHELAALARGDEAAMQVPAHLEAQMLAAWDRRTDDHRSRRSGRRIVAVVMASALAASVVLALVLPRPERPNPPPKPAPPPAPVATATAAAVEVRPEPPAARAAPLRHRGIAPGGVVESGRFIALGPDIDHEWSGSFQLARVRVPRDVLVNLGVLVEAHRAGEPVQADVMFGEDGLARAIRLSPVSRRVP